MSLSLQFSLSSSVDRAALQRASFQSTTSRRRHQRVSLHSKTRSLTITRNFTRNRFLTVKAIEKSKEGTETETAEEQEPVAADGVSDSKVELSELGAEIKKALQERKEEAEGNILSGVAEEIREIEWPVFGKVLGTTGVVLGVIAGSSVVLLTVNAVLAELSDRVFSGIGIEDFFS
ncbi:hypothetical protein SLEP1_g49862 [Rubroshorea leprosula]|uniref:Preprotein translocase subunit SECE1 n=1 Tax=Rubroshorea leprosula TaxID=152421 RepID=A0AAV5M0N2_9ROSI|nr:hypothetical protein SLEP1_g49862 [Rubroshorea leprosula]